MNAFNRHKAIIYLAAVFAMGLIAGGAVGYGLARWPFFRPPTQTEMTRHILADLTRELELTPDQVRQVSPVIENAAQQMQQVHKRTFDEVKQIVASADQEITRFLTPVQQQRMEEMHRKRDRRGPGGPPHGPPGEGAPPGKPPGGPPHGPPGEGPPHGRPPGDRSPEPRPTSETPPGEPLQEAAPSPGSPP